MVELKDFKENFDKPLGKRTLYFLLREGEILLAMKKRGFGQGRWNGVGGKLQEGETMEEAAIREAQEEVGVIPQAIKQVGVLRFYFDAQVIFGLEVHVFVCKDWEGEPIESEEMLQNGLLQPKFHMAKCGQMIFIGYQKF